jgi:hypothetical protein
VAVVEEQVSQSLSSLWTISGFSQTQQSAAGRLPPASVS